MDVKNLRKLKRIELYEIMLAQSEEIDCLRNQLEKIKTELADRRIMISQSGSIAEASMKLTNIFEEAQKAADLYLYNVKNKIGDVHEQFKPQGKGTSKNFRIKRAISA